MIKSRHWNTDNRTASYVVKFFFAGCYYFFLSDLTPFIRFLSFTWDVWFSCAQMAQNLISTCFCIWGGYANQTFIVCTSMKIWSLSSTKNAKLSITATEHFKFQTYDFRMVKNEKVTVLPFEIFGQEIPISSIFSLSIASGCRTSTSLIHKKICVCSYSLQILNSSIARTIVVEKKLLRRDNK